MEMRMEGWFVIIAIDETSLYRRGGFMMGESVRCGEDMCEGGFVMH